MNTPPELFGVPVAVLALLVAGAGFVLSLIALGWQFAKHLLDGGRVRVQLNAASWEPGFMLRVNRTGQWAMSAKGGNAVERIEVAQLVVENPGRTPVTVYSPGVAIEGDGSRQHRVSPRMFELKEYGSDSAVTDTVVRIEPYDRVTFLLDYWSLIPGLREKAKGRTITLRGVVEVAGKSRPRKSPLRRAWRIRPDQWTSFLGLEEISPRTVMFRPLYVSVPADDDGLRRSMVGGVLFSAMRKFETRPSRDEFQSALEEAANDHNLKGVVFGVAAWTMFDALDEHEGHLSPWTWKPTTSGLGDATADSDIHESSTGEASLPEGDESASGPPAGSA